MSIPTEQQCRPVGVFDSGVGGLSILRAIRDELPNESLVYYADTAYAPYGDRFDDEIIRRSRQVTQHLLELGCKAIVVACNTATAAAIAQLRAEFNLPIVGVEPGIKPAVERSPTKRVGILATSYTLRSAKFQSLVERFGTRAQLTVQACPGLVETIELPGDHSLRLESLLEVYLKPMKDAHIDTLVLGCTHYSFLVSAISRRLGKGVEILDTPAAVARELHRRLAVESLLVKASGTFTPVRYLTSAIDLSHGSALMTRLVGSVIELEHSGD
ncbi:MAG TPA: glutamate racemase [Marinobacterium sp.]|nr:glutamate racemase [Marinobacterium sp.]